MARMIPARGVKSMRHATHLFSNRRTLWQMIRAVLNGTYRMSFLTTVIVIAALAYVISPIDLIPDFLIFFGWLDDGFIIYLVLKRLTTETQRFNRFKAMERKTHSF